MAPKMKLPVPIAMLLIGTVRGEMQFLTIPDLKKCGGLRVTGPTMVCSWGKAPKKCLKKLARYGAMGQQIKFVTSRHEWAQYFRVGDTPTVLYLIDPSHDLDHPEKSSWAGIFNKPFPEDRPNYYTDANGPVKWNYQDPCTTWGNSKEMYAYNKGTLFERRNEMYQSLLKKLKQIY